MKTLLPRTLNSWLEDSFLFPKGIDQFFDKSRDMWMSPTKDAWLSPTCDFEESEAKYAFTFDLPGVNKNDIKIEVNDQTVTVSGEKKQEKVEEKNNRKICERQTGSFYRSFTLPHYLDANGVEANYTDGVLKVVIPKSEKTKGRQIAIK